MCMKLLFKCIFSTIQWYIGFSVNQKLQIEAKLSDQTKAIETLLGFYSQVVKYWALFIQIFHHLFEHMPVKRVVFNNLREGAKITL